MQVSVNGWINKKNVIYVYNGILSNFKKEGNSDICYNMDESLRHYYEWNKPVTKRQIFYDSTHKECLEFKLLKTKRRTVFARACRQGGMGLCCLMAVVFQFCKRKSILEMDSSDNYTTMWMFLRLLKMAMIVNLMALLKQIEKMC